MNREYLKTEGDVNLSSERTKWQEENIDDETAHWLAEDEKYFLHQSLSTPCLNVLQESKGAELIDLQQRTYLDFHGNQVHQAGFSHPKVIEAVKEQLDQMAFCTRRYTNIPAINLAKKLIELAPGDLNKILFAPGGTLAIGMAIKLARAVTGKHKLISMWDAFHGASLDVVSISGEAVFRKDAGPLIPGVEHIAPPNPSGCPFKCGEKCSLQCADYLDYVLEKEAGDVAAVIAETIRSVPLIPSKEYWQRIRTICEHHGVLLILDEIPTALGRSGKFFAFENFDIIPDMVVIGKGIGGGIVPFAGLLAKESFNDFIKERAIGHYTHEKNPVACAAGLATLQVIEEESLVQKAFEDGAFMLEELKKLKSRHPLIHNVRGIGLILGVELFRDDPETSNWLTEKIMYRALSMGMNFKVSLGNVITLMPPLIITRDQIMKAIDILDQTISEEEIT